MSDLLTKIDKICRVCLHEGDKMLSIFNKSVENLESISNMIMECSTVKIFEGDGFPALLCDNCFLRLESAYIFRQDCERSDSTLRLMGLNALKDCKIKTEQSADSFTDSINSDTINIDAFLKVEFENYSPGDTEDQHCTPGIEEKVSRNSETTRKSKIDSSCPIRNKKYERKTDNQSIKNANTESKKRKTSLTFFSNESSEEFDNDDDELFVPNERKEKQKRKIKTPKINNTGEQESNKKSRKIKCVITEKSRIVRTDVNVCYICFKYFSSKMQCITHRKNEHSTHKFTCDIGTCEVEFADYKELALHRKNVHSLEKNWVCPSDCEESFENRNRLNRHILSKHGIENPFTCNVCSKMFSGLGYLKSHMRTHTREHKCDICGKEFQHHWLLHGHKKRHTKDFVCEICGKGFSERYTMNLHIDVIHKGIPHKREKKHLCTLCGQRFVRLNQLKIHMNLHTGAKPITCSLCDYRCHSQHLLKSHMRKHTGEKPFTCKFCQKMFSSRSYLTIHERFHSGFRPYRCSKCEKGFTNNKDLKVHERTHTGIKLFKCEICNNSFTTLHYLRVHRSKH